MDLPEYPSYPKSHNEDDIHQESNSTNSPTINSFTIPTVNLNSKFQESVSDTKAENISVDILTKNNTPLNIANKITSPILNQLAGDFSKRSNISFVEPTLSKRRLQRVELRTNSNLSNTDNTSVNLFDSNSDNTDKATPRNYINEKLYDQNGPAKLLLKVDNTLQARGAYDNINYNQNSLIANNENSNIITDASNGLYSNQDNRQHSRLIDQVRNKEYSTEVNKLLNYQSGVSNIYNPGFVNQTQINKNFTNFGKNVFIEDSSEKNTTNRLNIDNIYPNSHDNYNSLHNQTEDTALKVRINSLDYDASNQNYNSVQSQTVSKDVKKLNPATFNPMKFNKLADTEKKTHYNRFVDLEAGSSSAINQYENFSTNLEENIGFLNTKSNKKTKSRAKNYTRLGNSNSSKNKKSFLELALEQWRSKSRQDEFLKRVYEYFIQKGITNMVLRKCLNLISILFVVFMTTFLFGCVDHHKIKKERSLNAVIIPQCHKHFSWYVNMVLYAFFTIWIIQFFKSLYEISKHLEIFYFYTQILKIETSDMNTITWNEIVKRLINVRNAEITQSKKMKNMKLDALSIANRIMRKENYILALINKDLIFFSLPFPIINKFNNFTKVLEWNLSFCLMNYVFDEHNRLKRRFLHESNRHVLSEGLKRRFIFMGIVNMIMAPFIVVFMLFFSFFRYFEEVYHEPGNIMTRGFTPYAQWQFMNFNELPHAFQRRIGSATIKANMYLNHFTNETVLIVARFIEFICGSFVGILIIFTVIDNELSLEFEIFQGKTVLFFIGLLGTIIASCRGMLKQKPCVIPNGNEDFNKSMMHPAWLLRNTLEDLQYMPEEWQGQLHTTKVKSEFLKLFKLRIIIFINELLGIFFTPFELILTLSKCSAEIIDFFREFSMYVDNVGYICSFSGFDFAQNGDPRLKAIPNINKNDYFASNAGKMEQSFIQFKPKDFTGSQFLNVAQKAENVMVSSWAQKARNYQDMKSSILPTGKSILNRKYANINQQQKAFNTGTNNEFTVDQNNLHLADLPLVNSQNMDMSMYNSMLTSQIQPNNNLNPNMLFVPGIFSLVNQLYDQTLM
ncbi:hypothetical protein BB561_000361 [Smittium simulii]|uniref:Autophagy-related protein 9 n=1 Tax=Smittium simulii TaxID=133385 RepID=A0A2T9YZC8_9FUNG|nr:hypothetical protein BB561_000361 [Smittium simulii]